MMTNKQEKGECTKRDSVRVQPPQNPSEPPSKLARCQGEFKDGLE